MAKTNDTHLKDLLEDISCGKIQLPEFQRNWTWDDENIISIIASVSLNYPMGAIMSLECGNADIIIKYRPIEGVTPPEEHKKDYFSYDCDEKCWKSEKAPEFLILDGQQRLTSLYQSMYSSKSVKTKSGIERYYYISIDKSLDKNQDRIDAILSIPKDKMLKENFNRDIKLDLSNSELEYKNKFFPLNIIFNSTASLKWYRGYEKYYKYDECAIDQLDAFNEKVIEVIRSYQLPVIKLDKETPREAVCKVFENVNTGGVKLTVFELVTASFATHKVDGKFFNLRQDWEACRKEICGETDIFNGIDETAFLTTVTLYVSYNDKIAGKSASVSCKKKDVLSLDFDAYLQNKDKVLLGFKIARKFLLYYQCVFRRRDLPYTTQIIPLAAVCAVLGESRCGDPNVIEILSRWYWCGVFGEMYGGANETRYANDIEDILNEIDGKESQSRTKNAAFFSSIRLLSLRTRNSAAYKGIVALLYKKKCCDFMNNISIDVINSMEESPDIHHIFPEAHCSRVKIEDKKCNSIVNKTPILPKTNRIIGGNAPSTYLKSILGRVSNLDAKELRRRVESHLIPYDALAADDFDQFFIARAKRLLDIIGAAMGKPVSDRGTDATIQQFGGSLE